MVERCVRILQTHGWLVDVEFTFSVYGERGSIDILAWQPSTRALLLVEVKTTILDLQALLATLDRKVRLAPALLATHRGWHAAIIGKLVFAPGSTQNRTIVHRHAAIFAAAFPARGSHARRWISHPDTDLAAIWLARPDVAPTPRRSAGGPSRIQRPSPGR